MERILLIDDEASIRMLGKRALECAGYEVTVAEDGQQGVESFMADPHDLVISDLTLPGEQPLDAVVKIRETAAHVPVLVISGHDMGGDIFSNDRVRNLVTETLAKPFELTDLVRAVKTCLQG